MFEKAKNFFSLFQQGREVANKTAWKNGYITGSMVGALLLTLVNIAGSYGYHIPMDVDVANRIGAGVVALVGVVLTAITSKAAGLPEKPADYPTLHEPAASDPEPQRPAIAAPVVEHAEVGDILNDKPTTIIVDIPRPSPISSLPVVVAPVSSVPTQPAVYNTFLPPGHPRYAPKDTDYIN